MDALTSLGGLWSEPGFWSALGQIVLANIVLSGDNAVVIAMAARALPARQRTQAVVWGSVAAVVLRIALTIAATRLLALPFLKIVGAVLLLYIGTQLLAQRDDAPDAEHPTQHGMAAAIRTILVADLVMSLDNVLAVAAAAHGNLLLLAIGLIVSVPLIVFGSTLLMSVMQRFPVIVTIGAALLGWLAGEMATSDPALTGRLGGELPHAAAIAASLAGAVLVVALGQWLLVLRRRRARPAG